ncbi:protein diaphanous homolog 3 isoform X2 [Anolis carolinensis]|uniref:protein diaphanous homolog 3 isoform X2 n=1 Tax=Anolis carolinensis TaxID=28377 RepID=UPI0007DB87F3|nr:PREDICTED: protein diaphanous homolog 3 isoform X2 [Anolis carolinensis]|eukprot:XP_016847758.1 PREDICTED: protein diaphanous homolog 3 isoform X2 [Anolis carolinensis]
MERGPRPPARGKAREKQPLRGDPSTRDGLGWEAGGGGGSSSSKKAKFHLHIKTLTDDVFDKFSSIRIPGSKKERPILPNMKQSDSSIGDWPLSADVDSFIPTPLTDAEILALFEKMMEDMNLNEDRKAPLREKDFSTKKEMVMRYMDTASKVGSFKSNKQISPQEFIYELKTGTADEKLISCLESLRVSLTSNPVSWVENFGHEGLGLLLDTLERLVETKHQDKILKKVQHKIIQCLKAFMNNKYGLERIMGEQRSFSLLAKTIDPRQVNMMTDVAKLLSAICIVGEENILEKILEALTTVAEEKNTDRFFPIVEGLRGNSVHLQIACMQLINALVTSPDDLDFRLHIRNEFMRCGLKEQLPQLKCINNDALDIQLRVFSEHKEEDMIEFSHRLGDIRSELDEANDVYNVLWNTIKNTSAEGSFLSILQHLLLIRNDHCIRPLYFKLIEECISQIVLHRSGIDPDFSYRKRLDVDFSHILDVCIEQKKIEELEDKASDFSKKFENEFLAHQETKAQLQKIEEKISHLDADQRVHKHKDGSVTNGTSLESPTHLPQVDATPDLLAPFTGAVPPPPPPPPPPLPASFTNGSGKPPLGVPPPPPLPTLSGAQHSPTSRVLPFGLKPKKEFKPEVTMKRLNWSKIRPQEMNENCFWILANDSKYENPDLLCKLEHTFSCQKYAKKDDGFEEKKSVKKRIKELKILDPKTAQNLSIFLGSFRVPYEQIKTMILEIDEVQLSESMVQNLINHLPEQKQLDELSKLKNEYNNLSDPEQFAIVMSNVKRLKPRLSAILFKLQFEEQVNNIKPDIMAVSAACEELKKSRSFSQLLELVLLMGNYMNAGSRNAQSFGFNLCSLCKLKDTKSVDQMTTLLHFLVEICEEKYPNILKFVADLQHLDKANRVSVESLEKSLKQMEGQLKQLERDLETFPLSEDIHDKFVTKMSTFAIQAKQQFQNLSKMHENMEKLYRNIMEYYALDLKKVSVEEFLTDLNNFRTMFMQATKDNMRRKEAEEKQSRARIAKEKAEKEKLERQENKKRLLEMQTEGDETGVMDSLLEALQSGAAFRDRRKRTTRFKENQQAPTEKLHFHHNMNARSTRNLVCKEHHHEMEANSSLEKRKAVGKREISNGKSDRGKETEPASIVPKGETIPEVEALLARLRAL